MTSSYPPAGPPSGPPGPPSGGGYGPPPRGGYGPPAGGGYGGGKPTIDPKSVNPLDWAILGSAFLAFIFSFFSFYSYDAKGPGKAACSAGASLPSAVKDLCSGDSASAWHGFFGWFGVLVLLVAAASVALTLFAPQVSLPMPARLIGLGAAALGIISLLLALAVVPDWPPVSDLGVGDSSYDKAIDNGHGFSYWIVLILAVVVAVLSFLRFQQTGGQLPKRGSGTGANSGAPAGYGPPPQAQGYGPPPGQGFAPPSAYPQQGPPPFGPPPGYSPPPSP